MNAWFDLVRARSGLPDWPYPVRYDRVKVIETDVLVLGGGIAGSHAAINAARAGGKVVVADKGPTVRSGSGGAGVDHWQLACTNPCSRLSPEQVAGAVHESLSGYDCGALRYIHCKESWPTLLDCEQMGVQIRDLNDEFVGADFRDDKTKLMFAYDYANRHTIRVHGHNMKRRLYKEMKRLGVKIHDRVMMTRLLTERGEQGNPVLGAMGVNTRTGEFYVFKAKATVMAMARAERLWSFVSELSGAASNFMDPNNCGDGLAMGWYAGAEFAMVEQSQPGGGPYQYIPYGVGNSDNSWHGTPIVDANGKEVPWVNRDNVEISQVENRFRPADDQLFTLCNGITSRGRKAYLEKGGTPSGFPAHYKYAWNVLAPDLPERIENGEFTLPFYSDLTSLPYQERRAIFGLMVGNEGKTRIPVYETYTKAGFDPEKDMLQVPLMPLQGYTNMNMWAGVPPPHLRAFGGGGMVVDWRLATNLPGLFAAGSSVFGGGAHASAATSGRYAGRQAASHAAGTTAVEIDARQIEMERERIFGRFKQNTGYIGWKELNIGIARVMQDYCGALRNEQTLKTGMRILEQIRESELTETSVNNPHELAHVLECESLITVGQMVMEASLARKSSSIHMGYSRSDYPEVDPPEWDKLVSVRQLHGATEVRRIPLDYHLQEPFASTYEENYLRFNVQENVSQSPGDVSCRQSTHSFNTQRVYSGIGEN